MSLEFKNYAKMMKEYKDYQYNEKSSQLFKADLIQYNIGNSNEGYIQYMKDGYEEMTKINLELSELNFEQEYANINDYEKWLCGV